MTMAACYANYEMASLAPHNHNFAHGHTTLISHQLQQQQQQQLYHHHHQLLNNNNHHHHHNHQQQQMHIDGHHHRHQHQQEQLQQEHLRHNHHSRHHSEHNQRNSSQYSRQNCRPQQTSNLLSTSVSGSTITRNANTSIVPSIQDAQSALPLGKISNQNSKNISITSSHSSSLPALKPATNNADSSSAEVSLCSLSISSSCQSVSDANAVTSKDFSVPLHVDCSVEYELPNQPKPPAGQRVEPLLMIHPCYFRKIESQRRSPFVNNMPTATVARNSVNTNSNSQSSLSCSNLRRSRQNQVMQQSHHNTHQRQVPVTTALYQQQVQQQQHRHSYQQQKMSQMSQQAHYPVVVNQHQHSQQQQKQQNQTELDAVTVNSFIEHTIVTNNRIANQGSTHSQQERITQNAPSHEQQRQQQHLLTRQQPCQASVKWDQITETAAALAARSNMPSNRILSSSYNTANDNNDAIISSCFLTSSYNSTQCDSNGIKALTNTNVGKRDAMISGNGIYSGSGNDCSKQHPNRHMQQQNSCLNIDNVWNRVSRNDAATAAIATSTGNAALIMDRSPTATVPSNYQAGPDTMPLINQSATMANSKRNTSTAYSNTSTNNTKQQQLQQQQKQQHLQRVTAASAAAVLTSSRKHQDHQRYTDKLTGKYRQYLKSQRMHPYLAAATAGNADVVTATNLGQSFSQFATTAASSFQQLQQISCYNV